MEIAMLFTLPLIAAAAIVLPLIINIKRVKAEKPFNRKRAMLTNIISFIGIMIVMTVMPLTGAFAEGAEAAAAAASDGFTDGMRYLAAALSTGMATIGSGIAVGRAAPAAIGAVSENDKAFTKALIFVALGEGVAIYGLLISILILFG